MKKYIAVGHFKGNDNLTSVAIQHKNLRAFRDDLIGNEFVAYAVMTEERFRRLDGLDTWTAWEEIKKMTPNYRKWNDVADYIGQCYDIMEERLAAAQ